MVFLFLSCSEADVIILIKDYSSGGQTELFVAMHRRRSRAFAASSCAYAIYSRLSNEFGVPPRLAGIILGTNDKVYNKDYSNLGSLLGSTYLGKLPYNTYIALYGTASISFPFDFPFDSL